MTSKSTVGSGGSGNWRNKRRKKYRPDAKRAHEEICVLVQVESQQAIDNIEAIAAVDGVDGVFVGPADLHASLGFAGETRHAAVAPIVDDAISRIRKAGKAPGTILTGDAQDIQTWIAKRVQFVAVGSDLGLLARGADGLARRFKMA